MADDELLDQEYDPRSEPSSSQPWLNLLTDAEKKFRDWQDRADHIGEYYADLDRQSSSVRGREFAMFWANINVLAPSVYARPPVPVVVPEFKDRDPVKIAASEMLERALVTSYGLTDIDQVMRLCRDDMLIVGRGVLWVRYEDKGEVKADKSTQTTGERAIVEFLNRRDFRHAPARTWPEVDWVARCGWMTRKEARERFGEKADTAPYVVADEGTHMGRPKEGTSPEEKAPIWEIWHRGLNTVVWVTEGVEDVLDQGPPHLKIEGFFPCPRPAYGTLKPGTLVPVPDYVYYKDQLEEINKLTARIHALSDAVQVKGFYPAGGEIGDAVEAALNINDDRRIMVPVSNFASFGGSGDPIIWMPIDMVATTIAGLIEMRRQIIDDVYQIVGLSDIMRGSTEATETLGAQQLKSQYGSIRIRDKQHELVRVARDATRIIAEIMAEEFSTETLLAMSQMELPTDADIQKQVRQIEMQVREGAQQLQQQMQMLQMQAVQQQLQASAPGPTPPEGAEPAGPGGPPPQPPGSSSSPPGVSPSPPGGPPEGEGPDIEAELQQLQEQAQQALQAAMKQVQDLQAQATVEDCINLLHDSRLSPFALDIETDSTIQPDEDAEKQRRAEFLQVFGALMQQLAALVEARPEAAEFAGEVLKFGLAPYRVGRSLESSIDKFVEQLEQSAQGEKPPSPEEIKAKAEAAKMMAEMQMKAEELKAKQQTEERKLMADMMKQKAEQEADREKMLLEAQIKQDESRQKMQLEMQKHQAEMRKIQAEMVKMQKDLEAAEAKMAWGHEDQQIKRQGAEQDFGLKAKEAEHRQGLAERQTAFTEKQGKASGDGQAALLKALSAPKRIIRGPDGRVAGVESVMNGQDRG